MPGFLRVGRSLVLSCTALALSAVSSVAAEPTFRELVREYVKAQETGKPMEVPEVLPADTQKVMMLEYEILLTSAKGNEETVINPQKHKFQIGDQIRVRIKPAMDMFVYIIYEGIDGKRKPLLPRGDDERPPQVKQGVTIELPDDGSVFTFREPAGREKLIVVATDKPVADLTSWATAVSGNVPDLTSEQKKKLSDAGETKLNSIVKEKSPLSSATLKRMSKEADQHVFVDPSKPGELTTMVLGILQKRLGEIATKDARLDVPFEIVLESLAKIR